ncbi:MAG: WS/DGAT/MGAT family O-acyltransferase [Oceanococcus sp.]
MKKLPVTDAIWLLLENRERPLHVGGLQLFEYPEDAPADFLHQIAEDFRAGTLVKKPFNQRLIKPYSRMGNYNWIEDTHFDLDYHFRHSSLPNPGRVRELLSLISRLHSTLLDRHRPLWETHLIEGLEGNRFALYTKIHHSVVDGVAAMNLAMNSFSTDPQARDLPPPWARSRKDLRIGREHSARDAVDANINKASSGARNLPGVIKALRDQYKQARIHEAEVVPYQAPRSILNQPITGSRRFAAQSYSLSRIKTIAKALDGTINDVVMAMCSSALRTYLSSQSALPEQPLIAIVPVSVRPQGEESTGNAIGFLLCNLATNVGDPSDRFSLIQESMRRGKERMSRLNREQIVNYALALTSPMVLGQLLGFSGQRKPMYNITISNVPGPRETLYWNGCKMTGLYPASLMLDGQALNLTMVSYADSMEFGVTACRKTLPSVQRVLDYLDEALNELGEIAGV